MEVKESAVPVDNSLVDKTGSKVVPVAGTSKGTVVLPAEAVTPRTKVSMEAAVHVDTSWLSKPDPR